MLLIRPSLHQQQMLWKTYLMCSSGRCVQHRRHAFEGVPAEQWNQLRFDVLSEQKVLAGRARESE